MTTRRGLVQLVIVQYVDDLLRTHPATAERMRRLVNLAESEN